MSIGVNISPRRTVDKKMFVFKNGFFHRFRRVQHPYAAYYFGIQFVAVSFFRGQKTVYNSVDFFFFEIHPVQYKSGGKGKSSSRTPVRHDGYAAHAEQVYVSENRTSAYFQFRRKFSRCYERLLHQRYKDRHNNFVFHKNLRNNFNIAYMTYIVKLNSYL